MRKDSLNMKNIIIILVIAWVLLLLAYGIINALINVPQPGPDPEIDIEIYGPSMVKIDEPPTYTVVVRNNGSIDLTNVIVNGTYGFIWSGNLDHSESKTFYVEYKGQYKDGEVFEVFVNGHSKEGEHVWDTDSRKLTLIGDSYDIIEALQRGYISAEFRGMGYCSGDAINLKISLEIEVEIEVTIETGLILINPGIGQNMVIGETIRFKVKPEIDVNWNIESYCLDILKENPTSSEAFNLRTNGGLYHEDVITLMKSLEYVRRWTNASIAIQIGVWVITDDVSEDKIPIEHTEEDIDDAKWLLENAGIDTSDKTLFQE